MEGQYNLYVSLAADNVSFFVFFIFAFFFRNISGSSSDYDDYEDEEEEAVYGVQKQYAPNQPWTNNNGRKVGSTLT